MKNRVLSIILAGSMVLSLAACGPENQPANPSGGSEPTPTEEQKASEIFEEIGRASCRERV